MSNKKSPLSKAAQARIKNYEAKSNAQESRAGERKRDNRIAVVAGFLALLVALGSQLGYANVHSKSAASASAQPSQSASAQPTATPSNDAKVPNAALSENRTWSGDISLNGQKIGIELDGAKAPQSVANFVSLAKKGFFKGVSCHRLTTEAIYVLQCGDPSGDGTGGPGYNFGPIENAPKDNIYGEGVLAMARRSNDAKSQGSQFFIVYKSSTLGSDSAGGYTVFGKIKSGLNVVKAIAAVGTADGSADGKPKNAVSITGVNVK